MGYSSGVLPANRIARGVARVTERRSHDGLCIAVWRCVSMHAVPPSNRECKAAAIPRHLAGFGANEGSALDPVEGSDNV
jgi:hypothetical protein